MALDLSNLLTYRNSSGVTVAKDAANAASSSDLKNTQLPVDRHSLVPGQTIKGTIAAMDGGEILLQIEGGGLLKAGVSQQMNLSVGQSLLFAIMGNSQNKITISPLFFNMEQNIMAEQALEEAGLAPNEQNLKMISTMMKEGMSIDRNSLLEMNHSISLFPQAEIENLVQMTRLGLELTNENITQFANYKNMEYELIKGMDTVIDTIPQSYQELAATEGIQTANQFYEQILEAFLPKGSSIGVLQGEGHITEQISLGDSDAVMLKDSLNIDENSTEGLAKGSQGKVIITENGETVVIAGQDKATVVNHKGEGMGMSDGLTEDMAEALLSKEELSELETLLKTPLKGKNLSSEQVLTLVKQAYQSESLAGDALKELFTSVGFEKLLKHQMGKEWMITPEQTADAKNVSELYERLSSQTKHLAGQLEQFVKADSSLMRSIVNLRDNVDFMNQLNQMFTYVQLPLKMSQAHGHGDLYVYTNKRSLAKADGKVSALLHLDMEHLGAMDVYIALENQKVGTKFYLQDEETIDFLAGHMDELTKRLEKKGYSMKAEMISREKTESPGAVMEEILKQNRNVSKKGIATYSFDVKA